MCQDCNTTILYSQFVLCHCPSVKCSVFTSMHHVTYLNTCYDHPINHYWLWLFNPIFPHEYVKMPTHILPLPLFPMLPFLFLLYSCSCAEPKNMGGIQRLMVQNTWIGALKCPLSVWTISDHYYGWHSLKTTPHKKFTDTEIVAKWIKWKKF